MWWLIIIFIILGLYILFRLIVFLTGNWRATLSNVISRYLAWKQLEPKFTNKQIFMSVLDSRYPKPNKDIAGLRMRMYNRKNQIKSEIEAEIESEMSVLNKYSIPILVYTSLLIEENNYLNQDKCVEELLEPITKEVKRQGFSKYC